MLDFEVIVAAPHGVAGEQWGQWLLSHDIKGAHLTIIDPYSERIKIRFVTTKALSVFVKRLIRDFGECPRMQKC